MIGLPMVTIKCPVCECDISSPDQESLSSELRAHLTESHSITEDSPNDIKGGMERLPSSMADPGGEMREGVQGSVSYDDEFALRQDSLYGVAGPPGHAALALRCPYCSEEVCGEDEDELSKHMREHVRDGHGIMVKKS